MLETHEDMLSLKVKKAVKRKTQLTNLLRVYLAYWISSHGLLQQMVFALAVTENYYVYTPAANLQDTLAIVVYIYKFILNLVYRLQFFVRTTKI